MTRKPRSTSRKPAAPTIPPDQADWPRELPALVRITPARKVEVESHLVAASRLVTRLQTQLRLLAQELRDAEAERDHLSQVAEAGEEESLVPVRYEVRGTDLCAVRDDDPARWPKEAVSVLARRPAAAADRTGLLPFDKPAPALGSGDAAKGELMSLPSAEPKSSRQAFSRPMACAECGYTCEALVLSGDVLPCLQCGKREVRPVACGSVSSQSELCELAPHEGHHAVAREGKVIRWSSESPDVRMSRFGSIVDGRIVLNRDEQTASGASGDLSRQPFSGLDEDGLPERCASTSPSSGTQCRLAKGHTGLFHRAAGVSWPQVADGRLDLRRDEQTASSGEQLEAAGAIQPATTETCPGDEITPTGARCGGCANCSPAMMSRADDEPSLAVNTNRPADPEVPFTPEEIRAAAETMAAIVDTDTRRPGKRGFAPMVDSMAEAARADALAEIERYQARVARRAQEEAEPAGRVKGRGRGRKGQDGPDASEGDVKARKPRGKAAPQLTAGAIRAALNGRLGLNGAIVAEKRARAACAGIKPDGALIRCADIRGLDDEVVGLLVRLLELDPQAGAKERIAGKLRAKKAARRGGAK